MKSLLRYACRAREHVQEIERGNRTKKESPNSELLTMHVIYSNKLLKAHFFFLITLLSGQPHSQLSPKGIQRPNGRDVKSVVAKVRTRVADSIAVLPLPPSYERLVY